MTDSEKSHKNVKLLSVITVEYLYGNAGAAYPNGTAHLPELVKI